MSSSSPPNPQEINQALQSELEEARARIGELEAKVKRLAEEENDVTTVLTRPEFNREVARMLAFDERYGGVSSIVYFDITSIQSVEARFGASMAAEIASVVAQGLTGHVRRSDIVGRLAANEYGVLLVRCNNENAWKKSRALAALLAQSIETFSGPNLGLDVSFGVYTFSEEENLASGLKQAAEALTKV